MDYAENSVNTTFASAHGMKNIHLINNNCTTALGCGGTASGIEVGTTNAGDSNAEYNNVALSGFNIGYRNLGTQNHFGVVFINPQIFFKGIGFQVHQVGPISIFGGSCVSNNKVIAMAFTDSIPNIVATAMDCFNNTLIVDATNFTTNAGNFECDACHFEASNQNQGLFITGKVSVILKGGVAELDGGVGTLATMFNVSGENFFADKMTFSSPIVITNLLTAGSPVEGTIGGFIRNPTNIAAPFVTGTNAAKIYTNFISWGATTPTPWVLAKLSA